MKQIDAYISEKLSLNRQTIVYKYYPKSNRDLKEAIKLIVSEQGLGTKEHPIDLNVIDTSEITDMHMIFDSTFNKDVQQLYVDISGWDVSNVTNMGAMFKGSVIDCDLSSWDVRKVSNMAFMFYRAQFDGDISMWNVHNVERFNYMFAYSNFTGKNGDISKWNVDPHAQQLNMFDECNLIIGTPDWYNG